MVNRNFLAIFFVTILCLSGATAKIDDKFNKRLKYVPSNIRLGKTAVLLKMMPHVEVYGLEKALSAIRQSY